MNTSKTTLESVLETNAFLQKKVENLQEQLDWFKRQVFGKRSEKIIDTYPEQPTLFDLDAFFKLEEPPKKQIEAHSRKTPSKDSNKIAFPEDLPVTRIIIDLSEQEKICPITNKPLVKIGEEISQKLAYKTGSYFIKEFIRPKYSSPKGKRQNYTSSSFFLSSFHDSTFK